MKREVEQTGILVQDEQVFPVGMTATSNLKELGFAHFACQRRTQADCIKQPCIGRIAYTMTQDATLVHRFSSEKTSMSLCLLNKRCQVQACVCSDLG